MTTVTEQIAQLQESYTAGNIPEALYINLLATLKRQLGTDFRKDGITLNVPPLQATVKDKKDRQGNIIERDVQTVKGGLVTVTGSIRGKKINSLYMNAEVLLWICQNSEAISEYLGQEHMEFRRAEQTNMNEGAMTSTELFALTV